MTRALLFSVTADDCTFDFFCAGGPGGQKQNKTASACRCTHRASGASGVSRDHRGQHLNKREAFRRMAESPEFKYWHRTEVARRSGVLADVEEAVRRDMNPKNIKTEYRDENGNWVEVLADTGPFKDAVTGKLF